VAADLREVTSPRVLPPRLASLTFADDMLGSDPTVAERLALLAPGLRALILGGSRPLLLSALVEHGLDVVALDSSRTALRRTRDALGSDSPVLLLADDPREMTIPGGVDVALLTSATWRAVFLSDDRQHILRSLLGALRPGGRLLVEIEELPDSLPEQPEPIPSASDCSWWRVPADPEGTMRVRAAGDEVLFATFSTAEAIAEIVEAGYGDVVQSTPEVDSGSDAARAHLWLTARTARGSA
jgi:SAM-dependent methyltransferase